MRRWLRTSGLGQGLGLAQRSLLVDMRDGRQCATRALLGLGLLTTLMLTRSRAPGSFGAAGLAMFGALDTVMFAAVSILGVGTFATAVAEEREHDTLGLLQMAGLRGWSIMLGKSIGAFVQSLLLLAVTLPFLVLCITLGGVSLDQVFGAFLFMVAWLVLVCGISVHASTVARSSQRASQWAGCVIGAIVFLPLIVVFVRHAATDWLGMREGSAVVSAIDRFRYFGAAWSPWPQLSAIEQASLAGNADVIGGVLWVVAVYVGVGVLAFVSGWLRFGAASRKHVVGPARRLGRTRRRGVPGRGVAAVGWKDFEFKFGGARGLLVRCVFAVGLVVACVQGNRRPEQAAAAIFGFSSLILFTEVAAVSARIVREEIRDNTLEGLVLLPVSIRSMLLRKVLAGIRAVSPWIVLCVVAPMFMRIGTIRFEEMLAIGIGIMLPVTVCVLTLRFSVFMRRAAFGVAFLVVLLAAMLFAFVMATARGSEGGAMLFLLILVFVSGMVTLTLPDAVERHLRES